ncbi:MAG TPA: serine/threonine protein kinase, partial [Deltaproteobacteria bacterium]|nr:serine/threonine protein kinase [Deltaproteobacteria bacterium]
MLGPYEIVRPLAEGGMAEVYQCVRRGPQGFEKHLVIKVLHSRWVGLPEYEQMFIEEAKLLAQLQHPNIVQVFEFRSLGGIPFLVMEYVHGPTLGALQGRASRERRYQTGPMLHAVMQICHGLDYAHRLQLNGAPCGLVHQDVSSNNILIDAQTGVAKLIDFGVARFDGDQSGSQVGILKGKLPYMAPEILMGQQPDGRADVFSVGVLLYRILTRRMPFDGGNLMADLIAGRYPRASSMIEISQRMEVILDRSLQADPAHRYQSAAELASDLSDELARMGVGLRATPAWIQEVFPAMDWGDPSNTTPTLSSEILHTSASIQREPSQSPPYHWIMFVALVGSAAMLISMLAAILAILAILLPMILAELKEQPGGAPEPPPIELAPSGAAGIVPDPAPQPAPGRPELLPLEPRGSDPAPITPVLELGPLQALGGLTLIDSTEQLETILSSIQQALIAAGVEPRVAEAALSGLDARCRRTLAAGEPLALSPRAVGELVGMQLVGGAKPEEARQRLERALEGGELL